MGHLPAHWTPGALHPLCARLRDLRVNRGLTQWEVAEKMGLNSQSVISEWETGATMPTIASFTRWAEAFGLVVEIRVELKG